MRSISGRHEGYEHSTCPLYEPLPMAYTINWKIYHVLDTKQTTVWLCFTLFP